jgi:tetratricopeptide (TPR) repeat protein
MHPDDPAPPKPLSAAEVRAAMSFAVGMLVLLSADMLNDWGPGKLSMLFVVLAWLPMLVIHELGHALVARLVGWDVLEMVIGYGPELARFRVGATLVALRAVPIEGHVLPTPRQRKHARLKSSLVYAAGPLAELLTILAIGALLGFDVLFSRSTDLSVIALQSVALVAAIGVVLNLAPHAMSGAPSDGLGILLSFSLSQAALEFRLALPYMSGAARELDCNDARAAHALVQQGLAQHPENVPLLITLARCEVAIGDVDRGLARLEELRTREGIAEAFETERLHAAAAAVLESGDRAWLENAAEAAHAAVERAPLQPEYLLTLGAVQLELSQLSRANETLQAAYRLAREPLLEDRCLSYLAAVAHARGQDEQAQLFARALLARTQCARLLARVQGW